MEICPTPLPGVGLRLEFVTERGLRVGIVSHRTGRREVVVYDREDPDTAAVTLTLTADEANGMAGLLATTRLVERLGELHRQGGLGQRAEPHPGRLPTTGAASATPGHAPAPAPPSSPSYAAAR